MKLEEGKTYYASDDDWYSILKEFRYNDVIECWNRDSDGSSGRRGTVQTIPATQIETSFEVTVLHLAPRTPGWDGARVVRDLYGDFWVRTGTDSYSSGVTACYGAAVLEELFGPCLPLVNKDGHVDLDTVKAMNGEEQ